MSRFFYLPLTFVILSFSTSVINHASVMSNKPIISNDYSFGFIMAMLAIAVILEFVYLFVEKMVLE